MAFNVTLQGTSYNGVPVVTLPQTGGGNALFYAMNGSSAWLGVDAELIQTYTLADLKLSATNFATWTPSTTASTIQATRTAGTFTANMATYDYYLIWETTIPVVMQSGATQNAMPIFLASFLVQNLTRRPSNLTNIEASNFNSNVCVSAWTGGNFYKYYGTTTGSMTYTLSTSYGFYATVSAATFSSSTAASPTVTCKTPYVSARCHASYMSTANAALVDQDNTIIHQKGYVYRVNRPAFVEGVYINMIRLANEVNNA